MVLLVAVSKGQSLDKIQTAFQSGQLAFGENYLQEALPKIKALKHLPIEWHFIGQLQSNKTRAVATHFSWVQSLDNFAIAKRLNNQRPIHLPALQVCIEINNTGVPQKPGIPINKLPELIEKLKTLPRLHWRGLMTTIPQDYHVVATVFNALKKQGEQIDILSMGMSSDYQTAIALGATMVRLGTAFFGKRQEKLR